MAGVIQGVIYDEGVPVLTQETINYIKSKTQSLLKEVDNWLIRASNYKQLDNHAFTISKKITDDQNKKTYQSVQSFGINFLGNENEDFSLKSQFQALNATIKNKQIDNAFNVSLESLLKDGYRILTQLGEALRGDEVRYQIYVHDGSSMGLINKVDKFNLNLDDFLGHGVRVDYKTGELKVAGIRSLKKSLNPNHERLKGELDLEALNLFINELRGYFLFAGESRKHILKEHGDKLAETVKTINLGHVFETAANYYPGLLDQVISLENDITNALSWQTITEAENYWKSFDENAKAALRPINVDIKKIAAIFETLKDPSPFWQGGEGGPGLANVQVKASRASVTTLHSLVRQMVRVSSIYHKISYQRVNGEIVAKMSKEDYDEEVIMGLLKMFDRRFTGHYQWNINF